jgi:6-phospho-3-hexuloisomerase
MQAFAIRLHQLGLNVASANEVSAPAMGPGDLLLVSAGPGYFASVAAAAQCVRDNGGRVFAFSANRAAPMRFADAVMRVPAQTLGQTAPRDLSEGAAARPPPRDELVTSFPCRSVLQLGGSYELALQLLLDIVAAMLQQDGQVSDRQMIMRLTNLY